VCPKVGLAVPQGRSGGCGIPRLPRIRSPDRPARASRYTDYAVPADHISLCEYLGSSPITGLDRLLGFKEFEAPKISRQSTHEVLKIVNRMHWPPLSPGDIPDTRFC
jgi:hypothetical protein